MIKDTIKTIDNRAKEQKGGYLSMFLNKLRANGLRYQLAGEQKLRVGEETIKGG